eukprot:9486982-Pyramimonas_sp.AAC.1
MEKRATNSPTPSSFTFFAPVIPSSLPALEMGYVPSLWKCPGVHRRCPYLLAWRPMEAEGAAASWADKHWRATRRARTAGDASYC